MRLEISEIVSTKKCPDSKICDSFVFEPETDEENLGTLLLICEAESKKEQNQVAPSWLVNYIAYKAQTSFYNLKAENTKQATENALKGVNGALAGLQEKQELDWLLVLNLTVAALSSEGEVFLAKVGDGFCFLAKVGRIHRLEEDSPKPKGSKNRAFEELSQGQLEAKSVLILLSSSFKVLKEKREALKKVLSLSSQKAVRFLEKQELTCFTGIACKLLPDKKRRSFRIKIPVKPLFQKLGLFMVQASNFFGAAGKVWGRWFKKAGSLSCSLFSFKSSKKKTATAETQKRATRRKRRWVKNFFILILFFALLFWAVSVVKEPISEPEVGGSGETEEKLASGTELMVDLNKRSLSFEGRLVLAAKDEVWVANDDSLLAASNKKVEAVFSESNQAHFTKKAYDAKNEIIYLYSPPGLLTTYSIKEGKFKHSELEPYFKAQHFVDMALFGDNFYLLEQSKNEVVKYPNLDFDRPQGWLSSEARDDLEKVLSFAIDGSIYIYDQAGEVGEYRLGKKIDTLDFGTISANSKPLLFTKEEFGGIYLYEPSTGLIKVYDKSKAKVEKEVATITGGIDFTVDPSENQAFILTNQNKIYQVKLTN